LLNTKLPEEISQSREKLGFNWIQIATDCAFKGDKGNYQEDDLKDGEDLYGVSKIAGDKLSRGSMQIRCSIVGPDKKTSSGLYSWFKRAIKDGTVKGFSNHHWNGVTSTAFARLAVAIFENDLRSPWDQHWVPQDQVSKYELLQLFADQLGYEKSQVEEFQTETSINRTLATGNQEANKRLWKLAGYGSIPSIEELCQEFIEIDKQLG
jgi:dTDP-4-dehydrorhamnose reductase